MAESNLFIIIVSTCISSWICCICFSFCLKKYNKENQNARLQNTRILTRHKIKPFEIDQPIDDEIKDAFEPYSIRHPQITGDENV